VGRSYKNKQTALPVTKEQIAEVAARTTDWLD
jgi:hypothetical protein